MSALRLPPGWEWRTGLTDLFEDPYEELVDGKGSVVASIDRLSSPPEYTVMGTRHLLAPEDWRARPGGNVVIAGAPDIRAAVIEELARLGMVPDAETPRASLADEAMGLIAAARELGCGQAPGIAQYRHTAYPRAPPKQRQR